MKAKLLTAFSLVMLLSGCAQVQNYKSMSKATNTPLTTSIGSELYQIKTARDLPNAFGRADLYGGKIDTGFNALYFVGLTQDNKIIFRLTDVKIESDATTMSRYSPVSTGIKPPANSKGFANGFVNSFTYNSAILSQKDKTESSQLPPNTVEFLFDPKDKLLELEYVSIDILETNSYSIKYVIRKKK